ncbi:hypothetical protein B0T25DRAFT_19292 [Lasiosphaeria hispida]|uniref:Uncharacterized protein n=1 Tax=Lasiosphaeria hispida TaxID=260671 RepID=A0AAJ0HTX8_9PEZI|nr:hypothetical protein B0T25DRAFT_19292 [Lasiosphaeria hispida]
MEKWVLRPLPPNHGQKISPPPAPFLLPARKEVPPPPSFNQPPIVKYERRLPPPLSQNLPPLLPYKPHHAHTTQLAPEYLHNPPPTVSTSSSPVSSPKVKVLVPIFYFPFERRRCPALIGCIPPPFPSSIAAPTSLVSTQSLHLPDAHLPRCQSTSRVSSKQYIPIADKSTSSEAEHHTTFRTIAKRSQSMYYGCLQPIPCFKSHFPLAVARNRVCDWVTSTIQTRRA